MQKKSAAIIYDFDGTLSPGSMQEHTFLPELGYDEAADFWREVKDECRRRDGDEVLTYMELMLTKSTRRPLTEAALRLHGAKLPFFAGVETWFDRVNEYADQVSLALEHYVVSSGIREMIDGSPIRRHFKNVFASSFAYGSDGVAKWPCVSINYTAKTQFLFRINKGIDNTWDNEEINRWVPMPERPLPFERMIFIGDGDTDIPSMKMTRMQGGVAIAVFDPSKWSDTDHQDKLGRLIAEDRANYVAPANYSPGGQLDVVVRGVIGRIARESGFRPHVPPKGSASVACT
jgi:2-hydroxy-3-keto-5-methylthiopentenyl-1-phosphate phosphatase